MNKFTLLGAVIGILGKSDRSTSVQNVHHFLRFLWFPKLFGLWDVLWLYGLCSLITDARGLDFFLPKHSNLRYDIASTGV